MTELAATPAADDELAIVDKSASETKRITPVNLFGGLATDAELATHAADTTDVHGIVNTAALLTTVAHVATTGQTANDHHNEAHTVASHSDTTGTGAELNTLTGGGNADALHSHAGVGGHAMLSVTHTDSLAAVVSRGSVIVANATPAWAEVTIGVAGRIFTSDGTDASWQVPAAVAHAATTGQTTDDHHAQSHTVVSHSDTTATGAELNTLVGGGATALHSHAVAHADTTGRTANDHHNESHTVVSHSDTTATGAELNTLVGGGATALHSHAVAHADTTGKTTDDHHAQSHNIASHSDTTGTGAELNTLTDGSNADTLHIHTKLRTVSKSITVEDPTNSEDLTCFYVSAAMTISKFAAVVIGASPSVTYTVRHGTDRSAAGAEAVTGGSTCTSTTTGDIVTVFNDATVVAQSFIWLETSATSGTISEFHLTIEFIVD